MPQVYQAVNRLQEVPWRINKRVFETLQKVLEVGADGKRHPAYFRLFKQSVKTAPRPEGPDDDPKVRTCAKETADRARQASEARAQQLRVESCRSLAERLVKYNQIYFPHSLDWRGRVYPIPDVITPQGWDLPRALLEFAEGKPVIKPGRKWIAAAVAGHYGKDKTSPTKRETWTDDQYERWEKIAEDPLKHWESWVDDEVDSPWKALAAIFDYVDMVRYGEEHISHLPVAVDGSCNGIQHLAAKP